MAAKKSSIAARYPAIASTTGAKAATRVSIKRPLARTTCAGTGELGRRSAAQSSAVRVALRWCAVAHRCHWRSVSRARASGVGYARRNARARAVVQLRHLQAPRIVRLEGRRQLVQQPRLLPNQPLAILRQVLQLLRRRRAGLQGRQMGVIRPQKVRGHPRVERSLFAPLCRKRSRARSNAFGLIGYTTTPWSSSKSTTRPSGRSIAAHSSIPWPRHSSNSRPHSLKPLRRVGHRPLRHLPPVASTVQTAWLVSAQSTPT